MKTLRPGLELIDVKEFTPKHENYTQKFRKPRSYKLTNPGKNKNKSSMERYRATTENMKFIIKDALDRKLQLRAVGRGWSFTKISFGKNGFIDTLALRLSFKMENLWLNPVFLQNGNVKEDVRFFQCGNTVQAINGFLEKSLNPKRCIIASGASNGQTIAGATSTGTHGGAFETGAVHDAIVGLHIVCGPDRHVFIEKKSEQVVSQPFIDALKVDEHIIDDDVFNSAVVSFGSFGIIHGIMLRTEKIFLLEKYRTQTEWTTKLKKAIHKLDFANMPLEAPKTADGKLYHFQVIINPYNVDKGETGIHLMYMYKRKMSHYTAKTLSERGYTYGDDTLGVVAGLLKVIPKILNRLAIKSAVNLIMAGQFPATDKFPWLGTMGETFGYSPLKGKTGSSGIAIDHKHAIQTTEIILNYIKRVKPYFGILALRFVKGTKATLGFTRFNTTCVLELDGTDNKDSREFYKDICNELSKARIPFTLHWGKINDYLTEKPLSHFYPKKNIDSWKASRAQVFQNKKTMKVFDNAFLKNVDLI